jgi:hypothetical protein
MDGRDPDTPKTGDRLLFEQKTRRAAGHGLLAFRI